jgi:hypothetical protein
MGWKSHWKKKIVKKLCGLFEITGTLICLKRLQNHEKSSVDVGTRSALKMDTT